MSPLITHFCHRARPQAVPAEVASLDAPGRLESILWSGGLRAFVTYSGGDPAVCFTEATIAGLNFVIGKRGYQPWALVFHRQSVYDAGGGPVWYARPDEHARLREFGNDRMRAWAVRLEAEGGRHRPRRPAGWRSANGGYQLWRPTASRPPSGCRRCNCTPSSLGTAPGRPCDFTLSTIQRAERLRMRRPCRASFGVCNGGGGTRRAAISRCWSRFFLWDESVQFPVAIRVDRTASDGCVGVQTADATGSLR